MTNIDCGPLKVFNPNTGKCIMEDGAVASKIRRLGIKLTRRGTCDGTIVVSKAGNPYCKPKTVIIHSNLPLGRDGVVDVIRRSCKAQEKEIAYLKQLRERNQKNIKDASSRISRLTTQLDTALRSIETMTGREGRQRRGDKRTRLGESPGADPKRSKKQNPAPELQPPGLRREMSEATSRARPERQGRPSSRGTGRRRG